MIETPKVPDEAARIMERMVRMPPKAHDGMKVGNPKADTPKRAPKPKRSKAEKDGGQGV